MKRFFNILLIISLLFSPIIQACPTCFGEKLAIQGYSKKQINSEAFRNEVLHAMRNEDSIAEQRSKKKVAEMVTQFDDSYTEPTTVTQTSKFVSQGKHPQHHQHKNKIGSSRRMIQYKTEAP